MAQCCGRARKVESSYRGVGCGCSQTSRPGRVAMVLEKMKHDCGKGPVVFRTDLSAVERF